MDIIKALAEELNIGRHQAEAAVKLIDEGNTIQFIARYSKEATGSLNDEVLRNLDERLKYLRNLEDRKEQVISAISDQGKMTAELEKQIREAATLVAVEDLYRPYKPKRRTRQRPMFLVKREWKTFRMPLTELWTFLQKAFPMMQNTAPIFVTLP